MKLLFYGILWLVIAPVQWCVSIINSAILKVWMWVIMKLIECRLRDEEKLF